MGPAGLDDSNNINGLKPPETLEFFDALSCLSQLSVSIRQNSKATLEVVKVIGLADVELHLALGWALAEPFCAGPHRVIAPESFCAVPRGAE